MLNKKFWMGEKYLTDGVREFHGEIFCKLKMQKNHVGTVTAKAGGRVFQWGCCE